MKQWLRALALGLALAIGTVGVTGTLGGCGAFKAFTAGESEQDVLTAIDSAKSLLKVAQQTIGELADADVANPAQLQKWHDRLVEAHGYLNQAEAALPDVQRALGNIGKATGIIGEVQEETATTVGGEEV